MSDRIKLVQAWQERVPVGEVSGFRATQAEARRVLSNLPAHSLRNRDELVWGVAAEFRLGQTRDLVASVCRAHWQGVSTEQLDGVLRSMAPRITRSLGETTMITSADYLVVGERIKATVRIQQRGGAFYGSGVLVDAGSLLPKGGLAVLTCAHVCCDAPGPLPTGLIAPLAPAEAEVVFCPFPEDAPVLAVAISQVLWSSPIEKFDAALLGIDQAAPDVRAIAFSKSEVLPLGSRAYLMGYPGGEQLHISLEESMVQGAERGFFSYRLEGRPGMSGGPVFNRADHQLAGIHQGRVGREHWGVLVAALQHQAHKDAGG